MLTIKATAGRSFSLTLAANLVDAVVIICCVCVFVSASIVKTLLKPIYKDGRCTKTICHLVLSPGVLLTFQSALAF